MTEKDEDIDLNKLYKILEEVDLVKFINKMPNGIDANLVNNAKLISGGEKQRIALARALYKDSQVMLLDEPLNNLDAENVKIFSNALLKIKKNRIVILVAHQKEIDSFCDKIYLLN